MDRFKWPKIFPPISSEQERIGDEFQKLWLEILPKKYSSIEKFNHNYSVKNSPKNFLKTLEIGGGIGAHLEYEVLSPLQRKNYTVIDIRENIVEKFREKNPDIKAIIGDCQKKIDYPDEYFDRILAIHVLEHLPNLPEAVKELHRLCNKKNGALSIVIPCEGSLAYSFARKISAQRIFEKKYKQSYKWLIEREHVNIPAEIFHELGKYFQIEDSTYFPINIKAQFCNLCIGASYKPRI